jgi:hypothetical protein
MSKVKLPIAPYQIKCAQALRHARAMDDELLALTIKSITNREPEAGHTGLSKMTFEEANALIVKLGGTPFRPPRTDWSKIAAAQPPARGDSARTRQSRRKAAGIEQVASERQIQLIAALASQRDAMSAAALTQFCKRVCGAEKPRTTKEANKIIEALKSMNRRDGLWHG